MTISIIDNYIVSPHDLSPFPSLSLPLSLSPFLSLSLPSPLSLPAP